MVTADGNGKDHKRNGLRRARDREVYERDSQHRRFRTLELVAAVTLFIIAGAVLAAIIGYKNTISDIQAGRREGSALVCAAISGVTIASRDVVSHLHNPAVAKRAEHVYDEVISKVIDRKVGRQGDHLVLPDGSLDCKLFEKISRINQ
jgi:hypothetical protein